DADGEVAVGPFDPLRLFDVDRVLDRAGEDRRADPLGAEAEVLVDLVAAFQRAFEDHERVRIAAEQRGADGAGEGAVDIGAGWAKATRPRIARTRRSMVRVRAPLVMATGLRNRPPVRNRLCLLERTQQAGEIEGERPGPEEVAGGEGKPHAEVAERAQREVE